MGYKISLIVWLYVKCKYTISVALKVKYAKENLLLVQQNWISHVNISVGYTLLYNDCFCLIKSYYIGVVLVSSIRYL